MKKQRIILATAEENCAISLQMQLLESMGEKIQLEIVTDIAYFRQLFREPQKAWLLMVATRFYAETPRPQPVDHLIRLTDIEAEDGGRPRDCLVWYKHADVCRRVQELLSQVEEEEMPEEPLSKSEDREEISEKQVWAAQEIEREEANWLRREEERPEAGEETGEALRKETEILVVSSASGGVGKTTVSLALAACLAQMGERVLYVDAEQLNSFQWRMTDPGSLSGEACMALRTGNGTWEQWEGEIRREEFDYLPPFAAPLDMLGLDGRAYEQVIRSAAESQVYDRVLVDLGNLEGESRRRILEQAGRVLLISGQGMDSAYALSILAQAMECANEEKYTFLCNDYRKEQPDAFLGGRIRASFLLEERIRHVEGIEEQSLREMGENEDVRRLAEKL